MKRLRRCDGCARHVFVTERACPFCQIELEPAVERAQVMIPSTASRAQRLALAAALGSQSLLACAKTVDPELPVETPITREQPPPAGSAGPRPAGSPGPDVPEGAAGSVAHPVYGAPVYGAPLYDAGPKDAGAVDAGARDEDAGDDDAGQSKEPVAFPAYGTPPVPAN